MRRAVISVYEFECTPSRVVAISVGCSGAVARCIVNAEGNVTVLLRIERVDVEFSLWLTLLDTR